MRVGSVHATVNYSNAYAFASTPRKGLDLTHARAISVAILPSLS